MRCGSAHDRMRRLLVGRGVPEEKARSRDAAPRRCTILPPPQLPLPRHAGSCHAGRDKTPLPPGEGFEPVTPGAVRCEGRVHRSGLGRGRESASVNGRTNRAGARALVQCVARHFQGDGTAAHFLLIVSCGTGRLRIRAADNEGCAPCDPRAARQDVAVRSLSGLSRPRGIVGIAAPVDQEDGADRGSAEAAAREPRCSLFGGRGLRRGCAAGTVRLRPRAW